MKILLLLARIIVALVVLLVVAILALWYVGRSKVEGRVQRRVPEFAAATDSSSIERGRHLASIACTACHSSNMDLPLAGPDTAFVKSAMFGDEPVKKPKGHETGMPIDTMSVDELNERIGMLEAEIVRLKSAIEARNQSKSAAASVFKF